MSTNSLLHLNMAYRRAGAEPRLARFFAGALDSAAYISVDAAGLFCHHERAYRAFPSGFL